jgi:hypothetical protein
MKRSVTVKCPKCNAKLEETSWPRVLQNTIFMIVLLIGYQVTLTFFVSKYDGDEIRNVFLLVANFFVAIIAAYIGKKGFEKFAVSIDKDR